MSWGQLLKRVFKIDIETCDACGCCAVKVIVSIEELVIVRKILSHLRETDLHNVVADKLLEKEDRLTDLRRHSLDFNDRPVLPKKRPSSSIEAGRYGF